jgi:hypothetical protein
MIVKEYYQNINIHKPRDYFERWYADLWNRRINSRTAMPDVLYPILREEMAKAGAVIQHTNNHYRFAVTFEHDADYTAFLLKWS